MTSKLDRTVSFCQVQKYPGNEGLTYFFQVASQGQPDQTYIMPMDEEELTGAFNRASYYKGAAPEVDHIISELQRGLDEGRTLKEKLAAEAAIDRKAQERLAAKYRITDPTAHVGQRLNIRV